jgi:hypothetical protein
MTEGFTGGCLCSALRYTAKGAPMYAGNCYCEDCRKASGSGFIPFIGVARVNVTFTGRTLTYRSKARRGGDAVRNSCAVCGGLVFGGELEISDSFTIYAGSLDDPTRFHPTIAIFARNCPPWLVIPPGLTVFEELPPQPT